MNKNPKVMNTIQLELFDEKYGYRPHFYKKQWDKLYLKRDKPPLKKNKKFL